MMGYLDIQKGVFYAQLRIPKDCQTALGKTAFRKTLKTSDRQEAERLATPLVDKWKADINAVRHHKVRFHTDPLTMNNYQDEAAEFAIYKWKVIYPALALSEEAGEVSGKLSKLIRDQHVKFDGSESLTDSQRADIIFELGDVMWNVANLAKDLGVSLNEVAQMNIEKLQLRTKRNTISGSGDHR